MYLNANVGLIGENLANDIGAFATRVIGLVLMHVGRKGALHRCTRR